MSAADVHVPSVVASQTTTRHVTERTAAQDDNIVAIVRKCASEDGADLSRSCPGMTLIFMP